MDSPLVITALFLLAIALIWYGFLLRRNAKKFSEDSEQRIEQNKAKLSKSVSGGPYFASSPVERGDSYYGANGTVVQPYSIWAFNPEELVSTIMMTAGFAILSTLTMNWFSIVVMEESKETSACVASVNTYSTSSLNASKNACGVNEAKTFSTDSSYTGRR